MSNDKWPDFGNAPECPRGFVPDYKLVAANEEKREFRKKWLAERDRANALEAHVERLIALGTLVRDAATDTSMDSDEFWDRVEKWEAGSIDTPNTNLARLKAQWQAEALERAIRIMGQQIPEGAWVCFSEDLQAMVNELRRQAEEGS